jgi:hypothetical protein
MIQVRRFIGEGSEPSVSAGAAKGLEYVFGALVYTAIADANPQLLVEPGLRPEAELPGVQILENGHHIDRGTLTSELQGRGKRTRSGI